MITWLECNPTWQLGLGLGPTFRVRVSRVSRVRARVRSLGPGFRVRLTSMIWSPESLTVDHGIVTPYINDNRSGVAYDIQHRKLVKVGEPQITSNNSQASLTFLMLDTLCSDKLFKTIPSKVSASGSFKKSLSFPESLLFRSSSSDMSKFVCKINKCNKIPSHGNMRVYK